MRYAVILRQRLGKVWRSDGGGAARVDGIRWYFTKGRGCVGVCCVPVLSSPTGESIALTIILRGTARAVTKANYLGRIQTTSAGTLGG